MMMHDVWLCVQAVVVALTWWRVWRLDVKLQRVVGLEEAIRQEARWRTSADNQRPTYAAYDGLNGRLNSLARALGYEWKRTEAKEGWERNPVWCHPVNSDDALAALRALEAEICTPPKSPTKRPTKKKPRRATH